MSEAREILQEHRIKLLEEAVMKMLHATGFVRLDVTLHGPEITYQADQFAQAVSDAKADFLQLVTLEEYAEMTLTSEERDKIYHDLDNRALAHVINYTLQNCNRRRRPSTTYEDAVQLLAEIASTRIYLGDVDPEFFRTKTRCEHGCQSGMSCQTLRQSERGHENSGS